MNREKNSLNFTDGVMAFFFAVLIPYLLAVIFVLILNLVASSKGIDVKQLSNYTSVKIINLLISEVAFLGIFLTICYIKRIDTKKYVFKKFKLSIVEILILILIGAVTLFGLNEICNLFLYLLGKIGYNPDTSLPFALTNFGWFALSVLLLCIIPAICEELLFRGIILTSLREKNDIFALFISALCFCLIHASPQQTILQFVMGVVLGYSYMKTNSLLAPILLHFTNNFIVVLVNYIQTINKVTPASISFTVGSGFLAVVYAIIALVIVAGLLILLNYYYKKKNKQVCYLFKFEKKYFKNTQKECITDEEKNIISLEENQTNSEIGDISNVKNTEKKKSNFDIRVLIISIFICVVLWIIQLL